MEIIIGRDPNTNHLAFLVDGKRGVDSSVTFPQSISRLRPNENMGHCRILIKNDDIRIINLNSENVTYVNGEEIKHSVKIDLHSIIELGMDQYRISLKKILKGCAGKMDAGSRRIYDETLCRTLRNEICRYGNQLFRSG